MEKKLLVCEVKRWKKIQIDGVSKAFGKLKGQLESLDKKIAGERFINSKLNTFNI